VRLFERFYLPSEGRVLIDGRDVGVYDDKWLKR
jgi:ABC-type multidrug transport system fused ATPase/permease subunit